MYSKEINCFHFYVTVALRLSQDRFQMAEIKQCFYMKNSQNCHVKSSFQLSVLKRYLFENFIYILDNHANVVFTFRSSHRKCAVKKRCSQKFCNIKKKHLIKKRLQHRCFSEYYNIFKNTFSCKAPPVAVSIENSSYFFL